MDPLDEMGAQKDARLDTFFDGLQGHLHAREHGRRRDLARFLSDLSQRLSSYEKMMREHDVLVASRFNTFDFIDPDENRLSDILADLLNPTGSHGQGARFLEAFLEHLNVSKEYQGSAQVFREAATTFIHRHRRRLDIRIHLGDFGVGIENKPWAWDQDEQVSDEAKELEKRYKGRFVLLYLSADGFDPTSIDKDFRDRLKETGQLVVGSYRDTLPELLVRFRQDAESDRVRWFLQDFRVWVCRQFPPAPVEVIDEPQS